MIRDTQIHILKDGQITGRLGQDAWGSVLSRQVFNQTNYFSRLEVTVYDSFSNQRRKKVYALWLSSKLMFLLRVYISI